MLKFIKDTSESSMRCMALILNFLYILYCYLHMRKLQLKKKTKFISSTKVSLVQLFQTVLLEKVEVLKSKI